MEHLSTMDLLRKHHSSGRALLHTIAGTECEEELEAEGSWIKTLAGNRYLDMGSFAVFLLGHRHPVVMEAVRAQLDLLPLSSRTLPSGIFGRACQALAAIAPQGLSKIMLLNTGSEATEAAIKLVRARSKRSEILYLEGAYHGKTFGALAVTDAELFKQDVRPLLPHTRRVSRNDARAVCAMIEKSKPAAVILEPIQGEGGVFELSPDYLRKIKAVCEANGTYLIADEIQCGLGRSGTRWAIEISGVVPDILLAGKSLGGGVMPVSALLCNEDVFKPYDRDPLLHSSTFAGNPLACAAVLATTQLVAQGHVVERVQFLSEALMGIWQEVIDAFPDLFTKISGRSLMLGLHVQRPDIAGLFIRFCTQHQLLLTPCLTMPSVVRISPSIMLDSVSLEFARQAAFKAAELTRKDIS